MNKTVSKNILVVEDDNDARALLIRMLQGLGHSVLDFGSGDEALKGIQGHKIEVALLDIMMPEMNGFELLEKLKAIPQYADIPVIMVTAKDKDSDILEGYSSGATYYITKPYTAKQLEYGIKIVTE